MNVQTVLATIVPSFYLASYSLRASNFADV